MSKLLNLKLGLAQINSTVGDLNGNTEKIIETIQRAKLMKIDLLIFPELALTGSPLEGLLLKRQFIDENLFYLQQIVNETEGIALVLGFIDFYNGSIYNSAAVIVDCKLTAVSHKAHDSSPPFYDEIQYFSTGSGCLSTTIRGQDIEIAIGEDILDSSSLAFTKRRDNPAILININANTNQIHDVYRQEDSFSKAAADNNIHIASTNLVGAQDGIVFVGGSSIIRPDGNIIARGKPFMEDLIVADLNINSLKVTTSPATENKSGRINTTIEAVYKTLVLGLKDYVNKSGFSKVVLGLSGGLDSGLVAVLAVDALGSENVIGVSMPSRYSSSHSISDVDELALNTGMKILSIPIERAFCAYMEMLNMDIEGNVPGITEQNLQARIRANILYGLSNKFGWLVLSCGNKSESSTGYGTLYGDMAGGFSVLKNIYKTEAYELANHRNSLTKSNIIPASMITKEPSAELAPNQKDTDTLPPYNVLDSILKAYIDKHIPVNEIVNMGYSKEIVKKVVYLVDKSEYKRRQTPPGVIVSKDQAMIKNRLPISNSFIAKEL